MKDSIGIGISKAPLDVHRFKTGRLVQFGHNPAGFRVLKHWIGQELPEVIVFEPTGPYRAVFEKHFKVVQPLVKINRYKRAA